jgi:UDP-N-acetylglucosamine 2-epimerase
LNPAGCGIQRESSSQNINVGRFALKTSTSTQSALDVVFADPVGVRPKPVVKRVRDWIEQGASVPVRKSPFGDGNAAERTVKILQKAGYC